MNNPYDPSNSGTASGVTGRIVFSTPAAPKGYWIARLDVSDVEKYKTYVEANASAFAKYGAKFLTRGGKFWSLEGNPRSRNVVLEFDSAEQAMRCYWSEEYQAALKIRRDIADADIIIMEGYNGPQPPEQPGELANVKPGSFRDVTAEVRRTGRIPSS